jgi:methyltransferase (TIGR00027 family)
MQKAHFVPGYIIVYNPLSNRGGAKSMLKKILEQHSVQTTALLAIAWKQAAASKASWPHICQRQGKREEDLFKDPLMQHFVDEEVKQKAASHLEPRMQLSIATRARFFRRAVSEAVRSQGVKQVIILGSGFDTLPARKIKYTHELGVKFFEIDKEAILDCKKVIYDANQVDKNAEYIAVDYVKENLIDALKKRGVNFSLPTLILWEGNIHYLNKEDVIRIIHDLSTHFEKPIITFDYMHSTIQTSAQTLDAQSQETSLEATKAKFASGKAAFTCFFDPAEIVSIGESQGLICTTHKTAADLAIEYQVDEEPYYTLKPYSMITFSK